MSPIRLSSLAGLGLLLGALCGTASLAAPREPVPPTVERQMLILTGGTESAAVRQWMAAHADALAALYPDPDSLALMRSDGVEGLKPGFFILAPSVCPADDADAAFYAALHEIPGAYVRTVQVPEDPGACRTAKTTEWWSLTLSGGESMCSLVRANLEPQEQLYVGDPNVIPPPPEGTADLPYLDGDCPDWWSAVVSASGDQMLINAHAAPTLRLATHGHLLELGRSDGGAEPVDPGGDLESVVFKGDVPVVYFIDHELSDPPPDAPERPEAVYTGSLEALFLRWGLEDRAVIGLDLPSVKRTVPTDAVEVFACVQARQEGATWVEMERRIVATTEGGSPPYCTDTTPTNNHGFTDAALKGRSVTQALAAEFTRVAGAPVGTRWTFVGMSGVGLGDLAVSTHTEIGAKLTGFAVAYDGKTVRLLEDMVGTLTDLRDLDHGRVLVCTDKGRGAFQSRTGAQLWWERGPTCPVVFRE